MQKEYEAQTWTGEQPSGQREERTRPMEERPGVVPTRAMEEFAPLPRTADETIIIGKPPPSFAWLIVTNGPRTGHLTRLNPRGTNVGRDAENDLILDDAAVSRRHARLRVEENAEEEEQYFIYDLATENGTFVNGEQIVKQGLEDGDEILMGQTTLVFKRLE